MMIWARRTASAAVLAAIIGFSSEASALNAVEEAMDGIAWGESSQELARHFGSRATVLKTPIDFGDSYADIVLRGRMLGGYPLIVYFHMDKRTKGLRRVQLERPRHGVNPMVARAVLAELKDVYGPPDKLCGVDENAANGYQAAAERIWTRGDVVIRAIYRDTTLQASEGCLFGDSSAVGACGLTAQLLVRLSPVERGDAECRAWDRLRR
jgi:hypothetical protein